MASYVKCFPFPLNLSASNTLANQGTNVVNLCCAQREVRRIQLHRLIPMLFVSRQLFCQIVNPQQRYSLVLTSLSRT